MSNSTMPKIDLSPHPSQNDIRNAILPLVPDIVRKLFWLMDNADNDSAKIGAARTLLNKVAPDLKAQEITGKDGEKLEGLVIIRAKGDPAL